MAEYWVAYFDARNLIPVRSFKCITPPSQPIGLLRDKVILAEGELKEIYICWHHWFVAGIKLHLLTCTLTALTIHELREVVLEAVKFAEEQCL